MLRETILPNGNKLVESISERVTIFNVHTPSGEFVSAGYQCKIDPDKFYEDQYEGYLEDLERDAFLKKHDPNRIDGRKVKSKFQHLGFKVNKVICKGYL